MTHHVINCIYSLLRKYNILNFQGGHYKYLTPYSLENVCRVKEVVHINKPLCSKRLKYGFIFPLHFSVFVIFSF
jgi:hypothetical protein